MKSVFLCVYALIATVAVVMLLGRAQPDPAELCRSVKPPAQVEGRTPALRSRTPEAPPALSPVVTPPLLSGLSAPSSAAAPAAGISVKVSAADPNVLESAEARVKAIERLVPLEPEQRRKLLEMYQKESELLSRGLSGPALETATAELGTEEGILGAEKAELLAKREEAESKAVDDREANKDVAYLTQALGLSEAQQQKLRETYESPDRYQDRDVAYQVAELKLADGQRAAVEGILRNDFEAQIKDFIESSGGVDHLPEQLTFTLESGVKQPDEGAIVAYLKRGELKKILSEEQMNRYAELETEEQPVN